MKVIEYHDMTAREYTEQGIVTSYTGGASWIRLPEVYGDESIWFVIPMAPIQIMQYFAANPNGTIRAQVCCNAS